MHLPNEQPRGRRRALIIATASYADSTLTALRAAGREAKDLAEVLRDEAIGAYEVEIVSDGSFATIGRMVVQFCDDLGVNDLALIYLSCHGVLDARGNLYYAAADTERKLLAATALKAEWLNEQLADCRARCQILILDCCHSGAFPRGAKGDSELALSKRFPEARGRVVLTASRASQYAFDGVFTDALVSGLRSGEADLDGDGEITATELFHYAEKVVKAAEERQQPTIWWYGGEGSLVVARSRHGPRSSLPPLPPGLEARVTDSRWPIRIGAVAELEELLDGDDPGLRLTARHRLARIAAEDIPRVARDAQEVLDRYRDDGQRDTRRLAPLLLAIARPPVRNALLALLLVAAVLIGVTWATGEPPAPTRGAVETPGAPTITIGAMYPRNATNRDASNEILDGERFAEDYINERGDLKLTAALPGGAGLPGLRGAKLKVVHEDPGNRCGAEKTFDRLVDRHHAVAVLGAYESTVTLRAIVAADRRKVPLVTESASAANLTDLPPQRRTLKGCGDPEDPRPSRWFFRLGPSDRTAAEQFFSYIDLQPTDTDRPPKLAILHEGSDLFGNAALRSTRMVARERGLTVKPFKYRTVLGSTGVPCRTVRTLLTHVADIKAYDPDFLFAASYLPDAIAAVQTMKSLGYPRRRLLAFGAGFLSRSFVPGAAKPNLTCGGLPAADPDGIIARSSWSRAVAVRKHPAIVKAFEKDYGPMTPLSAAGFTAVLTLAQAISEAESTKPGKIRDALRRLNLPAAATIMPWNGVNFDDENGQNTEAQIVLQQISGGNYNDIFP